MRFKKLNMNNIMALIIDIAMLILSYITFIRIKMNWYIIIPIIITVGSISDIIMIYKFKENKIDLRPSIMLLMSLFIVAIFL